MKHLKPIYIGGLTLEPIALDDGTLLFLHRRTDTALTGIAVIPADDIHEYALTENMEYAAMVIPFDKDADMELQKEFPERGVDTNFIFGSQAARAYDEGELFPEDNDENDENTPRQAHSLAEYDTATANHEGRFVHRTWNTKAEADAYAQGIDDMYDWMVYVAVEDEHIK